MKNIIILICCISLYSCQQDTEELQKAVIDLYNEEVSDNKDLKAKELVLINKKGNHFVGMLTTKTNLKIFVDVYSDGNEFFYWINNPNTFDGTITQNEIVAEVTNSESIKDLLNDKDWISRHEFDNQWDKYLVIDKNGNAQMYNSSPGSVFYKLKSDGNRAYLVYDRLETPYDNGDQLINSFGGYEIEITNISPDRITVGGVVYEVTSLTD